MVKETIVNNKKEYVCQACGYSYLTQELAERCEQWCTTHHSCNLEIVAQGTPPENL